MINVLYLIDQKAISYDLLVYFWLKWIKIHESINFFQCFNAYVPKDSPCSCDHFHNKILVVGGHLRRRNLKKQPKKAISHTCFVTSSMTSALWAIYHLKALNLNIDNIGRLSAATTWCRSRAKWTKTWKWH